MSLEPPHELSLGRRVVDRYRAAIDQIDDPRSFIVDTLLGEAPLLGSADLARLSDELLADVVGLGPLDELCADPAVTDVLVNGAGDVWVERGGRLGHTGIRLDARQFNAVVERTLGALGVRIDRACPIADGRMADGSRISVVLPPISVDGPLIAIRRFSTRVLALDCFGGQGVAEVLRRVVEQRANVVVYGPTGSGKTTLLNALGATLDPAERVVVVEDAAELRLPGEHVVRLEARAANAEGAGRVAMRELVRAALRLRPDRIVVGEVRGPEALDMVWAMSTGHDGSMSTCHANDARDALARIETFCLLAGSNLPLAAVRAQVRAAVDVLVGVERDGEGGRVVHAVHRVERAGSARLVPLLAYGRPLPSSALEEGSG